MFDKPMNLLELVRSYSSLDQEIKDMHLEVEKKFNRLKELEQNIIQVIEHMDIGITKLEVGEFRVSIAEEIKVAIPKESEEEAKKWLEDRGHHIMTKEVRVTGFDYDDQQEQKLWFVLGQLNLTSVYSYKVHWKTLQSRVRQILDETGEMPPPTAMTTFVNTKLNVVKRN